MDSCFFPDQLVPLITNSIETEPFLVKNYYTCRQYRDTNSYKFEFPGSIKEFEDLLKSILKKNSINEYVVHKI